MADPTIASYFLSPGAFACYAGLGAVLIKYFSDLRIARNAEKDIDAKLDLKIVDTVFLESRGARESMDKALERKDNRLDALEKKLELFREDYLNMRVKYEVLAKLQETTAEELSAALKKLRLAKETITMLEEERKKLRAEEYNKYKSGNLNSLEKKLLDNPNKLYTDTDVEDEE